MSCSARLAYLSLQEVAEGLDSWAAVNEVIVGMESSGLQIDRWFPDYGESGAPGPLGRLREMRRLQNALARELSSYDVLYVRGHPLALPAVRAAHKLGIPVVQECNGTYRDLFIAWPQAKIARPVFEWMQRTQYRLASAVVCVTTQLAQWVESQAPGARTVVIPNGVNVDVFAPGHRRYPGLPDRYAVFFGNFAPWQGLETLMKARFDEAWPSGLPLVCVGDGARRSVVERAVERDQEAVIYTGHVPYERMAEIVANAVCSVIPLESIDRAAAGYSPLKLYESLACGAPVVASSQGGVGEFVESRGCGFSFDAGDVAGLAAAVARITSDEARRLDISLRAREVAVAECSWVARAQRRVELVSDLLDCGDAYV